MMRQLMAELFIVATKADVPLIKILQQNNVDGDQLTEDELVMYNFAVASSGICGVQGAAGVVALYPGGDLYLTQRIALHMCGNLSIEHTRGTS